MKVNSNALKQALALVLTQDNSAMTVNTSDDGWEIYAMDPSRVSMAKIKLTLSAFEDFVATDCFTVDPEVLLKALNGKGDMVEFELANGQAILKGNYLSTKIPLLNPPEVAIRLPQLNPEVTVIMDIGPVKQIVKTLEDMMSMTVMVDENQVIFEGYTDTGEGTRLEIPVDDCVAVVGEGRSIYGLSILSPLLKALPNNTELEIGFSTDYPMELKFTKDGAECTWFGAPWIEAEGE